MLRDEFGCSKRALSEVDAKALLQRYGVAVPRGTVVARVEDLSAALQSLVPPFAVKLVSPDVLHKSDIGGVCVGLRTETEVRSAIAAMTALPKIAAVTIHGWLVEEMCPQGQEMVVGGLMDPTLGPLIMVGLGGIFVELVADVAFRICPIARVDALEMVEELKGFAVLNGARGAPQVSIDAIVEVLMRIGGPEGLLVSHSDEILELDLNPVIVSGDAAVAVDARILLSSVTMHDAGSLARPGQQTVGSSDVTVKFRPLFEPKSVAVVGASVKGDARANVWLRRIQSCGYRGSIYLIHPTASQIDGFKVYRSLGETPEPVDYAYVAIPAQHVVPLIAEADGRVRFAQVISSGFGETSEGVAMQDQLAAVGRDVGCRLVGPNCTGIFSPRGGLSFTDTDNMELGTVGVISQSGGLGVDIVRRGMTRGIRYSGVVTVGNCVDVNTSDLVEYFLVDAQTRVIGMYIETARDGHRLFELLRRQNAAKPVVILKGGRSSHGRRAAASHTGALAGDERAWIALARQTGSILVETLDQFIDTLLIFQSLIPHPSRPTRRVALFGNGGGASVLATDLYDRMGLEVMPFDDDMIARMLALDLPPGSSLSNPIDCPGGALQKEALRIAERVLETVYRYADVDAIVMHLNMAPFAGRSKLDSMDALVRASIEVPRKYPGRAHLLLVLRSDGEVEVEAVKRQFRAKALAGGVPVYDEMPPAGQALSALQRYERFVHRRPRDCAER